MSKKLIPLFIVAFLSAVQLQITFAGNTPTVKEQMISLNRYWLFNTVSADILEERITLEGDVALIQMHLTLVEKHLREKNTDHLSSAQKEKRARCLDILHAYRVNGVFPKNLYHKTRTPYFIDDAGTACAVGQLIISTGYKAVAQKINAENNYAYISELNTIYPELKQWADEFGFEIEELAWIQPGYGPTCDTTCTYSLWVWAEGGTEPYNYYWDTDPPQNTENPNNLCPGETYTFVTTDATGDTMTTFYVSSLSTPITVEGNKVTIAPAYELVVEKSSTPDYGNCDGTATVSATGGSSTYSYYWNTNPVQYGNTATGLCQGTYHVSISSMTCQRNDSVIVTFSTGIDDIENAGLTLYPNPANDKLTVTLPVGSGKLNGYRVMNVTGAVLSSSKGSNLLDISGLSKGIYYVFAETETGVYRQSFLKE